MDWLLSKRPECPPQKKLSLIRVNVQICWPFSIYLEAVAILPQLVLLQQSGNVDNLTGHTMHCIFSIGFVSILHSPISMDGYVTCFSGLIQTALYADFFYYYFIRYSTSIPILSVLSFT
uniref:ER lumen protein-retaining receptor n=1 Tax=Lactuca sativa TaxID=4236 RepID=A0A9R1XLG9_LACSA|nr:hypothetical protein LSAT_V11C300137700 [Lactuca sativa]